MRSSVEMEYICFDITYLFIHLPPLLQSFLVVPPISFKLAAFPHHCRHSMFLRLFPSSLHHFPNRCRHSFFSSIPFMPSFLSTVVISCFLFVHSVLPSIPPTPLPSFFHGCSHCLFFLLFPSSLQQCLVLYASLNVDNTDKSYNRDLNFPGKLACSCNGC